MRAAAPWSLAACAVAAMLACSPETEPASPVAKAPAQSTARAGGGAGGVGGMARAGAGGQPDRVTTAPSPEPTSGGSVALAVAAPAMQPMAAMMQPAAPSGPTAAIARVEPLARTSGSAGSGSKPAAASGGAGGASAGGLRPPPSSMQEQPSAELCERLQMATSGRPLPGNDRLVALLAACAVLQQPSAAAPAAAGSGGHGGANAGDLPAGQNEREPLMATGVFTHAPDGIALVLVLDGCKDGALYPVHIHAGHSCVDQAGIGERWDRTRGDDIPDLRCNGSHVAQEYVRSHTADKPWTLGGPSVSDVIGHVLVIGDPDDRSLPLACGVITAP